jgi:alcohol dehydrogenase (cytochrome c)
MPKPAVAAQGVACCDVVNRDAVYADGKSFSTRSMFISSPLKQPPERDLENQAREINKGEP